MLVNANTAHTDIAYVRAYTKKNQQISAHADTARTDTRLFQCLQKISNWHDSRT